MRGGENFVGAVEERNPLDRGPPAREEPSWRGERGARDISAGSGRGPDQGGGLAGSSRIAKLKPRTVAQQSTETHCDDGSAS